ncbi:hypothetical protein FACS1894218_6790 [Bacilli bacterium]|nr:hypothetical protein FACS1894218_6790 [Bacilli bacterium]
MMNDHQMNIGTVTLLISLSIMMSGSINAICEFAIKRIEYVKMIEIYKNFIEIANIEKGGSMQIIEVKDISYKIKEQEIVLKNGGYLHDANILEKPHTINSVDFAQIDRHD